MNTLANSSGATLAARRNRPLGLTLVAWLLILVLLLGAIAAIIFWASTAGGNVLTQSLSEPLNGATTAKIDLNSDGGNLTIDGLMSGEQLLASGTLQYFEHRGVPIRSMNTSGGRANLTVQGGGRGQPLIPMPWSNLSGGYAWLIHLNPTVPCDISAHTDGGNITLDLAGMALTGLRADTGGGSVEVVLPENAANLGVVAQTGGGNVTVVVGDRMTGRATVKATTGAGVVTVQVPAGVAARISATTGLGKVAVDSRFSKTGDDTYQSSDYGTAPNRIDITLDSGAGDVRVTTK